MKIKSQVEKILTYAKVSPVLVCGLTCEDFKNATVLPADISTKNLGIVNTDKGLKAPKWFRDMVKSNRDVIVIDGIDSIDKYNQNKFYELLKYQTITSVEFPQQVKIIVLYEKLENVSENITSLCQIIK